jgi:hypothetical protein
MNYTCESCNKSFSRSYNLLRHKKESCVARFNTVCAVAEKRCRLDDGASGSNTTTCVVCNISVPTAYFMAHQRTLEHRSNSCRPLSDGVEIVESAFKSRIITYRVTSNGVHIDYSAFFEEVKPMVSSLIVDQLDIHKTLKINMIVVGRYFLPSQDLFSDKSFNTTNLNVSVGSDFDVIYNAFVKAMKVQSTEFQEKDSGM